MRLPYSYTVITGNYNMSKRDKIDLLGADLFDETSGEEQSILENWKDEQADNRKLYELLRRIKLSSDVTEYAESVRGDILSELNSRIDKTALRLRWMKNCAAAIVALVVLGGTGYISYYKGYKSQSVQLVTLTTPSGTKSTAVLPDGSKVTLNIGSELIYPAAFTGKERKVSMVGEGFFEIAHDEKHPFIVSTEDINIQVLGTKFNVRAYDEISAVTLLEGKVEVSAVEIEGKVLLNPNEQATYTKGENSMTISSVNAENEISWIRGIMVFDDQPLSEVLKTLGRHYDAVFSIRNFQPDAINLTMTIRDEPLEQTLEYIRGATEINYEIKKNNHTNEKTPVYHVVLTQ